LFASHRESLSVYSSGRYFTEVLTDRVRELVSRSKIETGLVNIVLQHTTSALLLVEQEAGIFVDLQSVLEKLAPHGGEYQHHQRGVDSNGAAHVLSALLNKTLTLPIIAGSPSLGTYQEIMFMDFQEEAVERVIAVMVLGERQ
jgi:secondary thiamine-phosphate synthase enzyme